MHGSYTRFLMESVRMTGERARAAGAKAATEGAPREVPAEYERDRLASLMWLLGYDTGSAI